MVSLEKREEAMAVKDTWRFPGVGNPVPDLGSDCLGLHFRITR